MLLPTQTLCANHACAEGGWHDYTIFKNYFVRLNLSYVIVCSTRDT